MSALVNQSDGYIVELKDAGLFRQGDRGGCHAAVSTMNNILTRKLELFGRLEEDDRRLLDSIVHSPREVASHRDLIREGDPPNEIRLVLEGFCFRYKLLASGVRHIFGYLVPGDFCDLNVFILEAMDHSIATLTPSKVVDISRSQILEMTERPQIARALWWATLVDTATLREWLVNIGHRNADQRLAHLFCELHLRMQSVGLVADGRFEFPLTQGELGETMGLSTVHVNRTLARLRARELLFLRGKVVEIPNIDELREFGGFNPNYLHLKGGRQDHLG